MDGRRRFPAAVVTLLATAALLAGCGDSGGSDDSGDSVSSTGRGSGGSSEAGGGGPLDAAGLEAAALAAEDLPAYNLTVFQQGDALGSKGEPADPAVCQPIEDIRLRSPEPAPTAASARSVHPETSPGESTTIELYAYGSPSDAEELLTRVRTAAKDCSAGYEDDMGLKAVVTALDDPDPGPAADEAVAYQSEVSGTIHWYRVVRSGPTVAVFGWKSLNAHKNAGAAPDEVIDAQMAKLTGASD
ncbi:hypothetical protein [Streptomyces flavalbus]|uniref:Sensor domain-containing protein n=1 Tax=Streptomyces flavalbus TaxID=2665155 RepID=A0ABW2WCK0_9ACTN